MFYNVSHPFRSSWNFHSLWLSLYLGGQGSILQQTRQKRSSPIMTQCQPASRNATGLLLHRHTVRRPSGTEIQEIYLGILSWDTRNLSSTNPILLLAWKKFIRSIQKLKQLQITKICLLQILSIVTTYLNIGSLMNIFLHKYFIPFLNRRWRKTLKTSIYFFRPTSSHLFLKQL